MSDVAEIIEVHQIAKRAKTCSDSLYAQHAEVEYQLEQTKAEKNKYHEELIAMYDKAKSDDTTYDVNRAAELFELIKKCDEQCNEQWKAVQQAHIRFINARIETRRKIADAMAKAGEYLYPIIPHKRRVEIKVHIKGAGAAQLAATGPAAQPAAGLELDRC
jgi:hypothetical protein